jgi:hypothetical protein
MEQVFEDLGSFEGIIVLPPFPRKWEPMFPLQLETNASSYLK